MLKPILTVVLLLAPLSLRVAAQYGYGPSPYRIERWDEDYSSLADPAYRTDRLDGLKYISLGFDGAYLSLGGQARYRYD
jgi:hypothetical protein